MLDSTFQNACKLVDMQRISQALASAGIEHQVIALRSPMFQTPAKLNRQKREIPTRSSGDIVDPQEFVRHGRNGMNFTQTHDTLLANGYSNKEATMLCNIRNWADCDEH